MMNWPRVPSSWLTMSWAVFLLLIVLAFLVVSGFSLTIGLALGFGVALLCVWQFPFGSLYVAFCSLLLSGIIVPISTGTLRFGERAFGTAIEVSLGELVTAVVIIGWALRLLVVHASDKRASARPWLPLSLGFAAIIGAHLLSVFSPALPDPVLVVKYTLRPVLFVYLAAVALPANFVRSWRRMDEACFALVALAGWFALDGLRSLFVFGGDALGLYRAHPLTLFGYNPLGGNHHALAELMVLVAPLAFALAERTMEAGLRRWYQAVGILFWAVALLTFARAAWFVVGIEVLFFGLFLWRDWVRTHMRSLISGFIVLVPVIAYMVWFSLGAGVADSTAARSLLLDIAWDFFRHSPLVGVGAGTFPDRLAHVWAFTVEFGAAEDAHGMWQKLASETGVLGLAALLYTFWSLGQLIRGQWRRIGLTNAERRWFVCMSVSVLGALTYQFFSTSLWSPRVWISVGLLCAGMRLLQTNVARRDPDFLRP